MKALDRKLLRDIVRLWPQALAIALVMAAGVATLVLAIGASRSLEETRATYYERNRFADVFAQATRAPLDVARAVAEIPGVAAASPRIAGYAIVDMEGVAEPVSGIVISLPEVGQPRLNALTIREGRLPEPLSIDEIVVNASFADAHDLRPGSRLSAVIKGRRRVMDIVGVVHSPEFIYAIGPGDLVPNDRRFGVIWARRGAVEAAYDLAGAFNDITIGLARGASRGTVIDAVDAALDRYGGAGAYDRDDQISHAFLDSELDQLASIALIIPPIFLGVAAFLVNITVARLVALEREQIGLLKALGYPKLAIVSHYLKLAALIALVGVAIGWVAGFWLGRGLTQLFGEFYHFPFLVYLNRPDVYAISAGAAVAASVLGAFNAIWSVARLEPAVAMAPPSPPKFRRLLLERLGLMRLLPQAFAMAARNIARRPARAGLTLLGLAMSVAVLIGALFATDAVETMIESTYFRSERQDATLTFAEEQGPGALHAVARLPGVMRVEPFRSAGVRLSNGVAEKRVALIGHMPMNDLNRVVDASDRAVDPPEIGIALSSALARQLGVWRGDRIAVEVLQGRRRTFETPVTAVVEQYFGLAAHMSLDEMNRSLGDGPRISGAYAALDTAEIEAFYQEIKDTPAIAAVALKDVSLQKFRETMAQNIGYTTTIYTGLALVIAFGVVYNAARIQLSERARELASLRVLGFSRGETLRILLTELTVLSAAAIPIGWGLGKALAWAVIQGLQSDLFRVPLIVLRHTYAYATSAFLIAFVVGALLVRRRINELDLVAVLKTRD